MLRFAKRLGCLAVLALGLESALGFSLIGPYNEAYQTILLGYNQAQDIGAPKALGEGYRWNTPTNYYAFEESFLQFFGTNGVAVIDQGMDMLNHTLTNLSATDLSAIPTEGNRINYRAQQLNLIDLKSSALKCMMEELGLSYPQRFVWSLRTRTCPACPTNCTYTVVMRNYDPFTLLPSAYINGQLYSYVIREDCGQTPPPWTALAESFLVDGVPFGYNSTVASDTVSLGQYTTRLTQDDVGGFKDLYGTNNIAWESASPDSTLYFTNGAAGQTLFTSNLNALADLALTNSDAALATLLPAAVLSAPGTNYPVIINVPVTTGYYTNYPYSPYSTNNIPVLVLTTNYVPTVQMRYTHHFGNLEVVESVSGAWTNYLIDDPSVFTGRAVAALQTISVNPSNTPYMPYGTLAMTTNVSTRYFITNQVVGEYFLLPANTCDLQILANLLSFTNTLTNVVVTVTNTVTLTNSTSSATNTTGGGSNTFLEVFSQQVVTYHTNHEFFVLPVQCIGTNTTLRAGMNCVQFQHTSYDSLLGRFFQPVTNYYQVVAITNGEASVQQYQRVVTAPDVLFRALDMEDIPTGIRRTAISATAMTANALPAHFGPGTLIPSLSQGIDIDYNTAYPLHINGYPGLSETNATVVAFASFDGSTNAPVIYPSSLTLDALESQVLFRIGGAMPDGAANQPYSEAVPLTGGQAPYVWSLVANSAPPPPGLSLSSGGVLSGTPTQSGQFSFTATVTDAAARTATGTVTINIH